MAWVKLDDSMPMHPKLLAAGVTGFALDVAGLAYCNRYQTDGFIPAGSLNAVLPSLKNASKVAGKLVEVGRWEKVEGGWVIHDYLTYQPSKAHVRDVSEKRAAAGKLGGTISRPKTDGKQNASTMLNPVPSRPTDDDKSSSSLREFNTHRALAEAKKEASVGSVRNVDALATWKAKQATFRQESQRLWNHRECRVCKGKGFTEEYAPGAGQVRLPCKEPV